MVLVSFPAKPSRCCHGVPCSDSSHVDSFFCEFSMSRNPPSVTRRRRFCKIRHPYQTHTDLELSCFLKKIDEGSSYTSVSDSSHIKLSTLWRIHHKWIDLGWPVPYFMSDGHGRTTKLTHDQERRLCLKIDKYIEEERILQCCDVQQLARTMFKEEITHQLRS